MRLPPSIAAWSLLTVGFVSGTAAAEERVVRVPPAARAATPWPRCGSFADEQITRNVAYEISSEDPDEKWTFDRSGFGRRSPREDVDNCVETFVPTGNGCSGITIFQRSHTDGQWLGVAKTCVAGISDPNCSPGSTQPRAAGFVMHRAVSPQGTDGCWMQIRNWRVGPGTASATDFKFQWAQQ
jgi:hypothetical protein